MSEGGESDKCILDDGSTIAVIGGVPTGSFFAYFALKMEMLGKEGEGDHLSLSIKAAFGTEAGDQLKLTVGEGIAGDVIKSGKTELINNVRQDSRCVPGRVEISSMLRLPLRSQSAPSG